MTIQVKFNCICYTVSLKRWRLCIDCACADPLASSVVALYQLAYPETIPDHKYNAYDGSLVVGSSTKGYLKLGPGAEATLGTIGRKGEWVEN